MTSRLCLLAMFVALAIPEILVAQNPVAITVKEIEKEPLDTLFEITVKEPVRITTHSRQIKFIPQSSTSYSILPEPTAEGFHGMYTSVTDIIKEGDTYYMLYNDLVGGWPSDEINVALASSKDLATWKREPVPLLTSNDVPFDFGDVKAFPFATSIVKNPNGGYLLYFDAIAKDVNKGIAVATASSLKGPWQVKEEMILVPDLKSWDKYYVTSPQVLWTDGEFRMYYAGTVEEESYKETAIGLATSKDGLNWQRQDVPVFEKSLENGFDSRKVDNPEVIKDGDTWIMIYRSDAGDGTWGTNSAFGLATSKDGISWKRAQKEYILSEDDVSNWRTVWSTAFTKHNGAYHLFVEYDGPPVYGTRVNHTIFEGKIDY